MTDHKKKKEILRISTIRKEVSTFSQQIENQEKEFEEFVRSTSTQENLKNMIRSKHSSLDLIAEQANLLSEIAPELLITKFDGISMLMEEMNKVLEESQMQLFRELGTAVSALDLIQLLESSLNINIDELTKLEGSLIDLPTLNAQTEIDKFCTLNVDIKEFKPIEAVNNQYLLTTITRENIDVGNIKLKTMQQTQLQVQSIYREVKELKEIYIQDAIDKDDMLEELLDYQRNGGSSTVRVKKVKYNKKTAELIINDKTIIIKADTNQHYLCKILFASKASMIKLWENYEIVEAMGEDPDIMEGWMKVIYNTIRHLNEKIKSETGFDKFILYNNKTVLINPKYLDLS